VKLYGVRPGTGHNRGAIMQKRSGIDAVRNFWEQVWPAAGGHFAAWEQPQIFAAEVRAGLRPLRK
jgi:hypothetical protein